MKKWIVLVLTICMLASCLLPAAAESTLTGNAQIIFETVRANMNLPKNCTVIAADEYLIKHNKELTQHALLVQITQSEDVEMMYGNGSKMLVIDLDTGDVIDYKNFDGNVCWPNGDLTDRYTAQHLLYNCYWSYVDGSNDMVMSEHEFLTPLAEEEIAAINAELALVFGF